MPDPIDPTKTPTPTPTPAPAATSPPAAPPKPPEETPADPPPAPEPAKRDPLLDAMLRDMGELPATPEIKKVDEGTSVPATAAAPQEPKPAATTEPKPGETAPPAAEPTKKAKKKATILNIEPEIAPAPATATPAPAQPTPPAQPAQPAAAPSDPEAAYVAGLTDEQKAELEEAEMAERVLGDKYKGQRKKLIDWNKGFDAKVEALKKTDPDRKLDESDPEFMALLKTKPLINGFDQRKVITAVAEERAVERLRREDSPKREDIERRTKSVEIAPQVGKIVDQFTTGLTDFVAEGDDKDPLAAAAKALKADPNKVPEELQLEAGIIKDVSGRAKAMAHDYTLLVNGVQKFDEKNPNHNWLVRFVKHQGEVLAASPNAELKVRDGKTFVTREAWAKLPAGDQAKHWTYSHRDVMDLIAVNASAEMKVLLQQEEEAMKAKGFERRKAKPSAPPPNPPAPEPPAQPGQVRARPTQSKGAASSDSSAASAVPTGDIDVSILIPS